MYYINKENRNAIAYQYITAIFVDEIDNDDDDCVIRRQVINKQKRKKKIQSDSTKVSLKIHFIF